MNSERRWRLHVPVAVNLVLGIPAFVPCFMTWYILANGPLAALDTPMRNPTENDGMLPLVVGGLIVYSVFGLPWALINVWMRRRTAAEASRYWPACAAATVAPYHCLVLGDLLF